MRAAVDTNWLSEILSKKEETLRRTQVASELIIPFVVLAEFRFGVANGTRQKSNLAALERFLALPDVRVAFADDETIEKYVFIALTMRRLGRPIPTSDMWIAAITLQFGGKLFTHDAHFNEVPGLTTL